MARKDTIKIGELEYRLWSKWQDVWGNWQFWWQYKDQNGEWVNDCNGDLEWSKRMSAHYQVKISGEFAENDK